MALTSSWRPSWLHPLRTLGAQSVWPLRITGNCIMKCIKRTCFFVFVTNSRSAGIAYSSRLIGASGIISTLRCSIPHPTRRCLSYLCTSAYSLQCNICRCCVIVKFYSWLSAFLLPAGVSWVQSEKIICKHCNQSLSWRSHRQGFWWWQSMPMTMMMMMTKN